MALWFFVEILLFSLLLSAFADNTPDDIKWWCSQTPHPQPCEYFMSHKPHSYVKGKSDFHKLATQIALDRALYAHNHTAWLGPMCRNELEKVAWADCLELYDFTIHLLNHTINPSFKCTDDDIQTWLSSALTSLETCRTGFIELGVSDFMLPLMSNNVSSLISNTLAINKQPPSEQKYKDGFPTWVPIGDRKLLQAASPASSPASPPVVPASPPASSPASSPASPPTLKANLVVAQDGSGNFKTIQEAIAAASKQKTGSGRFVIYVKGGTYNENVLIDKTLQNIMMVGDGMGKTIVTGSKSLVGGSTTFSSATFAVRGSGFICRGMTFRNTAGPAKHQAVALVSASDLSVFYHCSFEGYQDTLYVHSQRQFYRECDIYGTVDFIFGNAAVVLQSCNIYARRPMSQQKNTITAQGRMDPNQNTGISIHNSRVMATSDLKLVQSSIPTFLGRPWKQYSRTVYLQTFLDSLIAPAGWLEWTGNFALKTLYYGEYQNTGPGSSTVNRVKWGGYRGIISSAEASKFTVANFISGGTWLPSTSVPFTASL